MHSNLVEIYFCYNCIILYEKNVAIAMSTKFNMNFWTKIWLVYNSVFQPGFHGTSGFRGTQRLRQFLAGFPENVLNITMWSV